MSLHVRLRRYIAYAATAIAALLVLDVAAIHVEQYAFRYRAEKLAKDVRSLQVRRTTFTQATDILAHWGNGITYDLPCSADYCNLRARVGGLGALLYTHFAWNSWEIRLYQLVGGKFAGAGARIEIRGGVVWRSQFELDVEVLPFLESNGNLVSYVLGGRLEATPQASQWYFHSSHPEYSFGWPAACMNCERVGVYYGPFAKASDVDRIGKINFDCVTRWRPCRTKADIMPGAMAQVALDRKVDDAAPKVACDSNSTQIVSRDAEDVAIVKILRSWRDNFGPVLGVKLVRPLKGLGFWEKRSELSLAIPDWIVKTEGMAPMHAGSKAIIMFDRIPNPSGPVTAMAEVCGVVPFNRENLQVVEEEIRRDDLVHLPDRPNPDERFESEVAPRKWSDPPEFPVLVNPPKN